MTEPVELRHYHGKVWHQHEGGNVPHNHDEPSKGFLGAALGGMSIGAVIFLVICLFIGAHVVPAEMNKSNPPPSCQLWGGHWDIWNGWQCG